jgi:hypothetical protein
MPIHDWSRIPAGIFHHFLQHWSTEIARTLNQGNLPKGLSALIEQRTGPKEGVFSRWSLEGRDSKLLNSREAYSTGTGPSRPSYEKRRNRFMPLELIELPFGITWAESLR